MIAHYCSDAQKYYVLNIRPGLITDGFFSRCRNPNYLGELMIYLPFAMLSMHWAPFCVVLFFFLAAFWPNMKKKDKSLSRYPEFESYKQRTFMLFPKLWGRPALSGTSSTSTTSGTETGGEKEPLLQDSDATAS